MVLNAPPKTENLWTFILGISSGCLLYPEVKRSWVGGSDIVDKAGWPFFQFQCSRYQKLFCKFRAPPVVKRRRSQCWAELYVV